MSENIEHEVLGEISKDLFENLILKFKKLYGEPKIKKRLAISFWDPEISKNLDTRIRITNGVPEIVQKVGEWENREVMKLEELSYKLPNNVDDIYTVYKILLNYSKKEFPPRIIQHVSTIFDTPYFEIKLATQFGKSNKYIFEVERKGSEDLLKFVKEIDLDKYILKTDSEFWLKWNSKVNLSTDDFTGEELKELIQEYLNDK